MTRTRDQRGVTELADDAGEAWRAVARRLLDDPADHAVMYSVIAEIVGTLDSLADVAGVLARQTAGYHVRPAGSEVYDDTGSTDPRERLRVATAHLQLLGRDLAGARVPANHAWSAVGHIGVRDIPDPLQERDENEAREIARAELTGEATVREIDERAAEVLAGETGSVARPRLPLLP